MGRSTLSAIAPIAVVLAAFAGCTGTTDQRRPPTSGAPTSEAGSTTPTASSSSPTASTVGFDCRAPIDSVAAPPEGYRSFADAVALNVDPAEVQLAERRGSGFRYFAKTGLLIRPGRAVTMRVAPEMAGRVVIGWGNVGGTSFGTKLVIPACPGPPGAAANWIAFPGGFHLDRAACVPLIIRSGGTTTTARVPVGTTCP